MVVFAQELDAAKSPRGVLRMEASDNSSTGNWPPRAWLAGQRSRYEERMEAVRAAFLADTQHLEAGKRAIEARSAAVDEAVVSAWAEMRDIQPVLRKISIVGIGGYGRCELFPHSDVDLLFLLGRGVTEAWAGDAIRRLHQLLWDSGLRVSPTTRTLKECEQFEPENVEFTLSLLDARFVAGDAELAGRLRTKTVPRLIKEQGKRILSRLLAVTETRHGRFGNTLFHLEPNIKECPGGLRDAHACAWLRLLGGTSGTWSSAAEADGWGRDFLEARHFLLLLRTFLHFRSGRGIDTLDWQAQDAAAAVSLGLGEGGRCEGVDAAYWMRHYFRHARAVEQTLRDLSEGVRSVKPGRSGDSAAGSRRREVGEGFAVIDRRISLLAAQPGAPGLQPPPEPEVVLAMFVEMASSGTTLSRDAERCIEQALPMLSENMEDGIRLWWKLKAILLGHYAGPALRAMHRFGLLELVIPEFHGIDALVIRDAYHRYTVDEHTFVLIDTLHALEQYDAAATEAPYPRAGFSKVWASRFGSLLHSLQRPDLLFLAALLHDMGKAHLSQAHVQESVRMAKNVLHRLELHSYDCGVVLDLVARHLEMSAALRRDVFDGASVRGLAERVAYPEMLRMLTLFTYADLAAVHPDSLSPWKTESLWRLYDATLKFLDHNVDEERVAADSGSETRQLLLRIHALVPAETEKVNGFLEGFPKRYLQTRGPEIVRTHFGMAQRLMEGANEVELDFDYAPGVCGVTLVSRDRPRLFATVAGVLAGWGMNILTADAFANASGIVVDTFRFTDTFHTLELNESERIRFVGSIRDVMLGKLELEALLEARKPSGKKVYKRRVETTIEFDESASSHSTLLQVVSQDQPGLLRAISLALAEHGCNIEVALIDTEGEMAVDVFYITRAGMRLAKEDQETLRKGLLEAMTKNAA